MITEECYKRNYLYRAKEHETGLKFRTSHPDGFTPVSQQLSALSVNSICKRTSVRCGELNYRVNDYVLQEFRNILEGKPSVWRIATICPSPNRIRFELRAKDTDESSLDTLAHELIDHGAVIVEVAGEDADERHMYTGQLSLIRLQCIDEDGFHYIELHVWHHSKHNSGWKSEEAFVLIEHSSSPAKRYLSLRWKDGGMKHMMAEIEETF